jgi:hypothetical protein
VISGDAVIAFDIITARFSGREMFNALMAVGDRDGMLITCANISARIWTGALMQLFVRITTSRPLTLL